jgi:hypothetical protein
MLPTPNTPKTCICCGREFLPKFSSMQVACTVTCAKKYAKRVRLAKVVIRKQALERIPDLIKAADKAFAAFIRERDRQAGHPCISSGKPLDWSGNQTDAGHYRSRGAASHLRYNEDNCHAQSKYENRHRAGNAVEYRIRLIARIGLARVEALESNNEVHHWTREELREKVSTYRSRVREMKKEAA